MKNEKGKNRELGRTTIRILSCSPDFQIKKIPEIGGDFNSYLAVEG